MKKSKRKSSRASSKKALPQALDKKGNPINQNLNTNNKQSKSKTGAGTKILNGAIDVLTSVKRIQINYNETNGTFLPGY